MYKEACSCPLFSLATTLPLGAFIAQASLSRSLPFSCGCPLVCKARRPASPLFRLPLFVAQSLFLTHSPSRMTIPLSRPASPLFWPSLFVAPQPLGHPSSCPASLSPKYLMERYFPEDRRDQFIYRGEKVRTARFANFAFNHIPFCRSLLNVRSTTTIKNH